MKQFILFAGDYYYPSGGWRDQKGTFNTFEEALEFYKGNQNSLDNWDRWEWGHILNTETLQETNL